MLGAYKKHPQARGCLKSWLLFRHPREFKIKSLYSNDLILNIASKSKETVQKLKFLDSPYVFAVQTRCCVELPPSMALLSSVLPCTLLNDEI